MIAVIQRVLSASVEINGGVTARTDRGLMVFVGIEDADEETDVEWLSAKIVNLRIFNDRDGVMNMSVTDMGGDIIVVSQFTLHASTRKGNRPSYIKAAKPEKAMPLYEKFKHALKLTLGKPVLSGVFGADMKVALVNDGPVTIIIDTKNKV